MDLPEELNSNTKPGQLYRLALQDLDTLMSRMEAMHAEQKEMHDQYRDLSAKLSVVYEKIASEALGPIERFKLQQDLLEKVSDVVKTIRDGARLAGAQRPPRAPVSAPQPVNPPSSLRNDINWQTVIGAAAMSLICCTAFAIVAGRFLLLQLYH